MDIGGAGYAISPRAAWTTRRHGRGRAGDIIAVVALRVMPVVGAEVIIDHLGSVERGVVHAVDPEARTVEVAGEHGRTLVFSLNRATATFTSDGGQTGSRLRFEQREPD